MNVVPEAGLAPEPTNVWSTGVMKICAVAFTACIILIGLVPGVRLYGASGTGGSNSAHVAHYAVAMVAIVAFVHFAIRLPSHMSAISPTGKWAYSPMVYFFFGTAIAAAWGLTVNLAQIVEYNELQFAQPSQLTLRFT